MTDRWDSFARLQDQINDIRGRVGLAEITLMEIGREFPDMPTIPEKRMLDAANEMDDLARSIRATLATMRRRAADKAEAEARVDALIQSVRQREPA